MRDSFFRAPPTVYLVNQLAFLAENIFLRLSSTLLPILIQIIIKKLAKNDKSQHLVVRASGNVESTNLRPLSMSAFYIRASTHDQMPTSKKIRKTAT